MDTSYLLYLSAIVLYYGARIVRNLNNRRLRKLEAKGRIISEK